MLQMPCQQKELSSIDHNYFTNSVLRSKRFRQIMLYRGQRCKVVQTVMCQLNEIQRNTLKSNDLRENFNA
jgi:hypothetical protein